jgi:hypothetical protein
MLERWYLRRRLSVMLRWWFFEAGLALGSVAAGECRGQG